MISNEKPAKGTRGFLLKAFSVGANPPSGDYFFRVYNEDRTFTDYDLKALYKNENDNRLDYTSRVLGKDYNRKVLGENENSV